MSKRLLEVVDYASGCFIEAGFANVCRDACDQQIFTRIRIPSPLKESLGSPIGFGCKAPSIPLAWELLPRD